MLPLTADLALATSKVCYNNTSVVYAHAPCALLLLMQKTGRLSIRPLKHVYLNGRRVLHRFPCL